MTARYSSGTRPICSIKCNSSRYAPALEEDIKNIIARRRAGEAGHNDGLSRLAAANDDDGSVLTDDELVGHTAFLFMAGHATTASALTWTLLLLLPEGGGWLHRQVVSDADCGCSIPTPPHLGPVRSAANPSTRP
jgi:hypothetical protein